MFECHRRAMVRVLDQHGQRPLRRRCRCELPIDGHVIRNRAPQVGSATSRFGVPVAVPVKSTTKVQVLGEVQPAEMFVILLPETVKLIGLPISVVPVHDPS